MKDPPERASGGLPAEETTAHTRGRYDTIASLYDFMGWPVEQWLYRSWRQEMRCDSTWFEEYDPVCGKAPNDPEPTWTASWNGQRYGFCSERCKHPFQKRPADYLPGIENSNSNTH